MHKMGVARRTVRGEGRGSSFPRRRESSPVVPAKVGIQRFAEANWTPACAGVTVPRLSLEFYHGLLNLALQSRRDHEATRISLVLLSC